MSIEQEIQTIFVKNKWTLSIAESCTGGAIAALLTQVPGSSQYFMGSLVAYSNDFKHRFVDVPVEILQQFGAVSEETVIAMAVGMMEKSQTYCTLAVTGISGPDGGSSEKPVGTVWVAVKRKGQIPITQLLQLSGNRSEIIKATVESSLLFLRQHAH